MDEQVQECEIGAVYRVYSRNLSVAVCTDGEHFIGIREKFGSRFLDTEGFNGPGFVRLGYHTYHSTHDFAGTWVAAPDPIGKIEGIPLTEAGDPPDVCAHCRGTARRAPRPGSHYYLCEGGCPQDSPVYGVQTFWNPNVALFDALDEFERQLFPDDLEGWYSRRSKFPPEEDDE